MHEMQRVGKQLPRGWLLLNLRDAIKTRVKVMNVFKLDIVIVAKLWRKKKKTKTAEWVAFTEYRTENIEFHDKTNKTILLAAAIKRNENQNKHWTKIYI